MSVLVKFKKQLKGYLDQEPVKYQYYRLKRYFSTRGIYLPFAGSINFSRNMWSKQGTTESFPNPETYLQTDGSIAALFSEVLPYLKKDAKILEIGCNAGRNLKYLYDLGFRHLSGIEIGAKAVELMQKAFPEMYRDSKISVGDVTQVLKNLATDEYDLVYCHSVLVSIHPKFNDVFKQMARISKRFVLILENEGSYSLYPRDFQRMFEKNGLKMVSSRIYIPGEATFPIPYRMEHVFKNNSIRLFVKDFVAKEIARE